MDKAGSGVSNVRWVGMAQAGKALIQLMSIAILARIVAPRDFGVLAMAMVVTGIAGVLRDMGTAAALIQMRDARAQVIDAVFWFNVGMGLSLGATIALTARLVSAAFDEPALVPVLMLMAVASPITSLGTVQSALMERDSRFREIAWVELSSLVLGFGLAVIGASYGLGARALALQPLATAAVAATQLWTRTAWRPRLRCNPMELRSLVGFSGNVVGFGVVNYLTRNADNILIGKFLGPADLGVYDLAYRTALFPLHYITGVIGRALFPIYARKNLTELGQYYLKSLGMLAFTTSPIVLGLWSLRRPFVAVVLGDGWKAVGDVLAWLGPMAMLQCLTSSTGVVVMAAGRTGMLRNIGLLTSFTYVSSFVIGVRYGIVGVARAYFVAEATLFGIVFFMTFKSIGLNFIDLIRSISLPILAAIVMAGAVTGLDAWLGARGVPSLVQLAVLVPAGGMIYVCLVAIVSPASFSVLRRVALGGWSGR